MKILYGITKSNLGGAQRYVLHLAKEAKKRGHEVVVLLGGDGELKDKLEEEKVRVISIPHLSRDIKLFNEFKSFFEIVRILNREKPDIFHINSSKMGGMGTLAGRITGVNKIIFTAHGWAFNEERHWLAKLFIEELAWLTIFLSHLTICVSDKLKRDVEDKPLIRNRLVVIKNGLDDFPLLTREEARRKLDIEAEQFTVGTLAELHHIKGHDITLRAINKTAGINLVILGEGDTRNSLKQLANTLGITERVSMPGNKKDGRKYLKAFDIFVLASRSEGLPYVLLEAGYANLGVVASEAGGIPEVIQSGRTGLLFKKGDYRALAGALSKLQGDSALRKRLGEGLKNFVSTTFAEVKMFDKTFALYARSD